MTSPLTPQAMLSIRICAIPPPLQHNLDDRGTHTWVYPYHDTEIYAYSMAVLAMLYYRVMLTAHDYLN